MKDKLSDEIDDYKNEVKKLRENFNKIKKTGVLLEDFDENIKKTRFIQNELLEKLIPYYRNKNIEKTKIYLNQLKKIGSFENKAIIESVAIFNEETLIVSNSKGELCIVKIDSNQYIVEWSELVNIGAKISYIEKISDKELLLLGESGEMILIEILENIKNNTARKYFKILKRRDKVDEYGFLEISKIGEKCYIRKKEENLLEVFYIEVSLENIDVVEEKRSDIYIEKEIIDSILVFNTETIFIGTHFGNMYCYRRDSNRYFLEDKRNVFDFPISNISKLESDDENIIVFSSKGDFRIYSFNESEIYFKKSSSIDGEVFRLESRESTGVMISQEGRTYIIEENNKNWYINENITKGFFIKVLGYKDFKYLLFDLDSNIYILQVDRISSVDDLYNKIKFS
ncbi:MAG: hypothetical protein RR561_01880 [Peptostreptococcus sp.]|uniref:hypothetical protein n=1 Tax=Peptostreptococcus sp. TaxID=1262 RepID=UPI002FCB508D